MYIPKERIPVYEARCTVLDNTHVVGVCNKGAHISYTEDMLVRQIVDCLKEELIDSYHAIKRKNERDIDNNTYASILSNYVVKRIEYTDDSGVHELKVKIRGTQGKGKDRCMVLSVLTGMVCTTFIQYLPEPKEFHSNINLSIVLIAMLEQLNK